MWYKTIVKEKICQALFGAKTRPLTHQNYKIQFNGPHICGFNAYNWDRVSRKASQIHSTTAVNKLQNQNIVTEECEKKSSGCS